MKTLISVIVPVYKTELFLNQCISSLVNQTYGNLEIILIDDGSPDNAGEICDEWRRLDERIKVLHVKNGGAGKARNIGIAASKGDYITFVDSDDYISHKMYARMVKSFDDDIDIVECDYIEADRDQVCFDENCKNGKETTYSTEAAMNEHIHDRLFKQVIWNKIYRRNILEGICFPEGKLIDDEFWTYRVIGRARKLVHINDRLYAYRQQNESVMHEEFSLKRIQAIEAKKERLEFIADKFPRLYWEAHNNLWLSCLYMEQMSLKYLSVDDAEQAKKIIIQTMKEYPLLSSEIVKMSPAYVVWGLLSKISFTFVCKVRNKLNIGI